MAQLEVQIGKNGLTENFLTTLKTNFKNHDNVRISVLKSAGHEKSNVKEISEKILQELGNHYTAKVIGFKIVLKKWRKARR
jgi:RNA-binding protein YhbY